MVYCDSIDYCYSFFYFFYNQHINYVKSIRTRFNIMLINNLYRLIYNKNNI